MPSIQNAEKALALAAAGLCMFLGIAYKAVAPFQEDPVRYERLSDEGRDFRELALALGLGTGMGAGIASALSNRNHNSNNDEQI